MLIFGVDFGYTFIQFQSNSSFALAVTNGDVGAPISQVPEVPSALMWIFGILTMARITKLRKLPDGAEAMARIPGSASG